MIKSVLPLVLFLAVLILGGCAKEEQTYTIERYPIEVNKRYGFINAKGEVVIEPRFYSVDWFSEHRAVVELEAGKKAIIDKQGKVVFQDTTGYLRSYFNNGLIRFDKKDGTSCFIDTLGVERFCLPDSIVDSDDSFFAERLWVRYPERRYAFLNTNGEIAFEVKNGFPGRYSHEHELAPIFFEGRTCYINKNGRRKFCVKGRGQNFPWGSDLAMVVENGKTHFVDRRGKKKIDKLKNYDAVASFINGFAKIEKGDRKGFIDRKGREVIPPVYEDAVFCSSGLFAVKPPGEDWIFVDKNNTQVIPQSFWRITMPGFVGELAYVYIGAKQGYINKQGKFVWTFDGNKMDSQLSIE